MKKFKVGDHVMICPSSMYWGEGDSNPSDTKGEVTRDDLTVDNHIYQVEWDNGRYNVYRERDLIPYDEIGALLDEARRRFKPGCRYLSTDGVERQSSESDFPYVHSTCPTRIALASGQGLIYDGANGEWGEVIPGSKACKIEEDEPAIPFKHPYDNCVIEVLDEEHGREVIEWWQDQGVDTRKFTGSFTREDDDSLRFYGLNYGCFNNFDMDYCVEHGLKIIELPSESSTTKGNIHSQIKTKQNGSTKQQAESGKTIKVQRVDLQIRKGSIGRRAGLKGAGVEVSIGNRHRNHKTRSILG